MSFTASTLNIIKRPIAKEKIKQRKGGAGLTFDYISTDTAIDILNEAFNYRWNSRIVDYIKEENTIIVCVELTTWDEGGHPVSKQQYGSCQITRGLQVGEAFKGAASDALKKAATHFGIGLELYYDEAPTSFVPPSAPSSTKPAPNSTPAAPPRAPAVPRPPVAPPKDDPFGSASKAPASPAAAPAPIKKPQPASPRVNPFEKKVGSAEGPNPTQLNALTNLASRKSLSQGELIALAEVVDEQGNPKTEFESLKYDEAIKVIRAAQQ